MSLRAREDSSQGAQEVRKTPQLPELLMRPDLCWMPEVCTYPFALPHGEGTQQPVSGSLTVGGACALQATRPWVKAELATASPVAWWSMATL